MSYHIIWCNLVPRVNFTDNHESVNGRPQRLQVSGERLVRIQTWGEWFLHLSVVLNTRNFSIRNPLSIVSDRNKDSGNHRFVKLGEVFQCNWVNEDLRFDNWIGIDNQIRSILKRTDWLLD